MKTVRIEAARPYDAIIGYDILSQLGAHLAARRAPCKVALVSDETVHGLYGAKAEASLQDAGFAVITCLIAPGEATKTMQTIEALLAQFAQAELTRTDIIVALGGGVTGDISGFAASVYLRGIEFVQVPTTLLAAVDASIGGKTGVNLPHGKNMIGTFWQPSLVLCDCDTFETLPSDTFLDGVAESLKYGVICDRSLFEKITSGALEESPLDVVARCVEIKAGIIAGDERDHDGRRLLNLGHTIAHAIETLSGYTVPHGQAVAIGMVGMARMAEGLGLCVMGCAGILMAMMDRLDLPVETDYDAGAMARAALSDKKRHGESLSLVLPKSIGQCTIYEAQIEELPRLFRLAKGERG